LTAGWRRCWGGDPMAPSDDDRPLRTLAADAFLGSVEAEARHAGTGPPGIHHWVLAACSHPFLVRMIAPDVDIDALGALARERLAAGDGGEVVTLSEVVALATRCDRDRGDERIQQWHVCRAVLERAGVACAVRPAKPPDTPVAEARPVPQPSQCPRHRQPCRSRSSAHVRVGDPAQAPVPAAADRPPRHPDARPCGPRPPALARSERWCRSWDGMPSWTDRRDPVPPEQAQPAARGRAGTARPRSWRASRHASSLGRSRSGCATDALSLSTSCGVQESGTYGRLGSGCPRSLTRPARPGRSCSRTS